MNAVLSMNNDSVTIDQAIEFVRHGIKNKFNTLLMGSPGCGKSQSVAQAADLENYYYHEANPCVKDPVDFKGLFGLQDGKATVFPLPDLRLMINADKPTVVNFDDISWASLAVQAPVLQITQSRMIDGIKISPHVAFVITSNRRKDGAGSNMLAPLINRFCCLDIRADVGVWVKWAVKNKMPAILIAFAKFKEVDIIKAIDEFVPSKDLQPFVSFRSLANLGMWYNSGMRKYPIYRGLVGSALATEFVSYEATYNDLKEFDTNNIIKDPLNAPIPKKQDVLYAVTTKLAFIADQNNFDKICIYASRLNKAFQTSVIVTATERDENLKATHGYIDWLSTNASQKNNII